MDECIVTDRTVRTAKRPSETESEAQQDEHSSDSQADNDSEYSYASVQVSRPQYKDDSELVYPLYKSDQRTTCLTATAMDQTALVRAATVTLVPHASNQGHASGNV